MIRELLKRIRKFTRNSGRSSDLTDDTLSDTKPGSARSSLIAPVFERKTNTRVLTKDFRKTKHLHRTISYNLHEAGPFVPMLEYTHALSFHRKLTQIANVIRSNLKERGIEGVDGKLLRELNEDNVDDQIISEEIEKLSEEYDLRAITCRQRMVHFLHTIPVEVFMIVLVVIDVLIILSMVVLDMYILEEKLLLLKLKGVEVLDYFRHTNSSDYSYDILNATDIDAAYKYLNGDGSHSSDPHHRRRRAAEKPVESSYGDHDTYDASKTIYDGTKANHILHYCSIAILAVFVIEVGLKIIGYGKTYFKNKWEVVDGIVIIISFSLDVAVTDANFSHEVSKTVLVVFLMWRMIRILNAIVLTSRARTMFRLRVLRKSKRIAEDKNRQLIQEKGDMQNELKRLRHLAQEYGAPQHELKVAQVLSKSNVSLTKAGLKNMMAQILHLNTKIASTSCTSLNHVGRSTSRRPSMIGEETICHEQGVSSNSSNLDINPGPMRARAASDAGVTKLSRLRSTFGNKLGRNRRDSIQSNMAESHDHVSIPNNVTAHPSASPPRTPPSILTVEHETLRNEENTKPLKGSKLSRQVGLDITSPTQDRSFLPCIMSEAEMSAHEETKDNQSMKDSSTSLDETVRPQFDLDGTVGMSKQTTKPQGGGDVAAGNESKEPESAPVYLPEKDLEIKSAPGKMVNGHMSFDEANNNESGELATPRERGDIVVHMNGEVEAENSKMSNGHAIRKRALTIPSISISVHDD